jgi:hypothetical protein
VKAPDIMTVVILRALSRPSWAASYLHTRKKVRGRRKWGGEPGAAKGLTAAGAVRVKSRSPKSKVDLKWTSRATHSPLNARSLYQIRSICM